MGNHRFILIMVGLAVTMLASCDDDPSHPSRPLDTRVPTYYDEWQMNLLWGMTVDDEHNLHVVHFDQDDISKYSHDGDLLEQWFVVDNHDTLDVSALTYVNGYFVALAWSRVIVLDKTYTVVRSWPEKHPRYASGGGDLIDADGSGNLYVLDDNYNRVATYGIDGSFKGEWSVEALDTLGNAWVSGIAVTDAGEVYIAQKLRNRILVYSKDGKLLRIFGKQGSQPSQLNVPAGLDISNGVLYIADTGNFRVKKFTTLGSYLSGFYTLGTYGSPIDVPVSVAVDGNTIFVQHSRSVVRFDYEE